MGTGHVVIYRFVCTPTGKTYVGKHECDPSEWPGEGRARLPDGYPGTGQWVKAARRKHGDAAFTWAILEVVAPGGDWQEAERRHVAAERKRVGKLCMNIRDGGEGFTSGDMVRQWRKRSHRTLMKRLGSKHGRMAWADPEVAARTRAGISANLRKLWTEPAYRNQLSKTRRRIWYDTDKLGNKLSLAAGRRLAGAVTRRDNQVPPWPGDNDLLTAAKERRNPLALAAAQEPRPGTVAARVLAELRQGPVSTSVLAARLGVSEKAIRTKGFDRLRRLRWQLVPAAGKFRLVV